MQNKSILFVSLLFHSFFFLSFFLSPSVSFSLPSFFLSLSLITVKFDRLIPISANTKMQALVRALVQTFTLNRIAYLPRLAT